jgi:hypothetical protein
MLGVDSVAIRRGLWVSAPKIDNCIPEPPKRLWEQDASQT